MVSRISLTSGALENRLGCSKPIIAIAVRLIGAGSHAGTRGGKTFVLKTLYKATRSAMRIPMATQAEITAPVEVPVRILRLGDSIKGLPPNACSSEIGR